MPLARDGLRRGCLQVRSCAHSAKGQGQACRVISTCSSCMDHWQMSFQPRRADCPRLHPCSMAAMHCMCGMMRSLCVVLCHSCKAFEQQRDTHHHRLRPKSSCAATSFCDASIAESGPCCGTDIGTHASGGNGEPAREAGGEAADLADDSAPAEASTAAAAPETQVIVKAMPRTAGIVFALHLLA